MAPSTLILFKTSKKSLAQLKKSEHRKFICYKIKKSRSIWPIGTIENNINITNPLMEGIWIMGVNLVFFLSNFKYARSLNQLMVELSPSGISVECHLLSGQGFHRSLGKYRVSARKKCARLSKVFCRWTTPSFFNVLNIEIGIEYEIGI